MLLTLCSACAEVAPAPGGDDGGRSLVDGAVPPVDARVPSVDDGGTPAAADNTIAMRSADPAGELHDYPLQIGRPFRAGEVAHFPGILVDGAPIPTQADVKQRHPDGSVRYAILSAIVPVVPTTGTTITFRDQSTGNNDALAASELLDARFDFEATATIRSGASTSTASARQMLEDGSYTTWTSGPIATTVVLADHSAARRYDMGFDAHRSIRPVFIATFWPTLGLVRVRVVLENTNTQTLQDVQYDVALTLGQDAPATLFEATALRHFYGTRWSRIGFVGSAPSALVDVDASLSYLASTHFVPSYDTTHTVSESAVASTYASWNASAHASPYDSAMWTRYMPTTGGRPDIGPLPAWVVQWLYTGDHRLRETVLGMADLASAWPLHFREGDAASRFDRAGSVPGVGRVISINAHPDLWFPDNAGRYSLALPTPRLMDPDSSAVFGGWTPDGAHQPDPFSIAYLLTGDYFYLEAIQFWASANALAYAPGQYGRGLSGRAGMQDQIRGNGWVLRNRTNAAMLSPDGTPERQYFDEIVDDAIALWEGQRNITGTQFAAHPQWAWARTNIPIDSGPLRFWDHGLAASAGEGADVSVTDRVSPLWMTYYLLGALGVAAERGYPTAALLEWHAVVLNSQFGVDGYDPHHLASYRTPQRRVGGAPFTTWPDTLTGLTPEARANTIATFGMANDNPILGASAAAFTRHEPGGDLAWAWFEENVRSGWDYDHEDISWNLVPRAAGEAPLER